MKAAPIVHWRKTPGIKPPCGKVSMYVRPEKERVTCPVCREAISAAIEEKAAAALGGWEAVGAAREGKA